MHAVIRSEQPKGASPTTRAAERLSRDASIGTLTLWTLRLITAPELNAASGERLLRRHFGKQLSSFAGI
jgi:hypothetical protein